MRNRFFCTALLIFAFFINVGVLNADCKENIMAAGDVFAYSENVVDGIDIRIELVIEGLTENAYVVVVNDYNEETKTYYYSDTVDGVLRIPSPDIYEKIKYVVKSYTVDACLDDYVQHYSIETDMYNIYSTHEICNSGYELSMCGQFYDISEVTEEEFYEKMELELEEAQKTFKDKLIDFIKEYYLYVLIPVLVVSVIFIIRIIVLKRGKRNE